MTHLRNVITIDNGLVSSDNSSADALGISGVFTGDWEDTLNYNTVTIGVLADEDSATDGLVIQWSADGVIVTQPDVFSILADAGKVFTFSPANQYLRVVYTNGTTAQTSFSLQIVLKKGGFKASSHRIKDTISEQDDAELTTSIIKVPGTDPTIYHNVDIDNPLRVLQPPNDYWKELILGNIDGESTSYVGGQNLAVQPGFPANIWYQGGLEVYLTADTPLYASSTDAADAQTIIVAGAKDTYEFTDGIADLNGQNQVLLDNEFFRSETFFNIGPGDTLGDIYIAEQDTLTAGVPDTASKIHMKIPAGLNLSSQGSYTIKKDKLGYLCQARGSVGKGKDAAVGVAAYFPAFGLNYLAAPMRTYQGPFSFGDSGGIGSFGEGTTINSIATTPDAATPVTINYRIVEVSLV